MVRGRRMRSAYNAVSAQADDNDDDDDNHAIDNEETEVFVDEDNHQNYHTVSNTNTNNTAAEEEEDDASFDTAKEHSSDDKTVTDEEEDDDDANMEDQDMNDSNTNDNDEEQGNKITLVLLDPAQKKFQIPAYDQWTVAKFKAKGERVHKVAPASQRLIYRGQMLQDEATLASAGLDKDGLILHLFPKPRVVIQQNRTSATGGTANASCSTTSGNGNTEGDDDEEAQGGAHVPQIVLNADEAEQRATILVLGSADFLEAQNNVKLFSFLLLVISSIELFNLILILMGVPQDAANNNNGNGNNHYDPYNTNDDIWHIDTNVTDASYNSYGNTNSDHQYQHNNNDPNNLQQVDHYEQEQIQEEMQIWHPRNNVDFIVSALGVYVALLGIRATNETTLRVAKQYMYGTVVVGIAWMMYNFWFTVHVDEELDQMRRDEQHNYTRSHNNSSDGHSPYGPSDTHYDDDNIPYRTDYDYYMQNLSLMMIPGMVWILCCVRAWQFQYLLEEAEQEATERIRNEVEQQHRDIMVTGGGSAAGDDVESPGEDEAAPPPARRARGRGRRGRRGNGEDGGESMDLELQNASATIT